MKQKATILLGAFFMVWLVGALSPVWAEADIYEVVVPPFKKPPYTGISAAHHLDGVSQFLAGDIFDKSLLNPYYPLHLFNPGPVTMKAVVLMYERAFKTVGGGCEKVCVERHPTYRWKCVRWEDRCTPVEYRLYGEPEKFLGCMDLTLTPHASIALKDTVLCRMDPSCNAGGDMDDWGDGHKAIYTEVISVPEERVLVEMEKSPMGFLPFGGGGSIPLGLQRIGDGLGLQSRELDPIHPALFSFPHLPHCNNHADSNALECNDCIDGLHAALECLCDIAIAHDDLLMWVDFGVKCLEPPRGSGR
jgi:hypothetical protein